ncbi:hypothetical protein PCK1_001674 [Pneumocystis canis]|nr:hypothetical protein PCK1_001674 [Pneumocystis canis]
MNIKESANIDNDPFIHINASEIKTKSILENATEYDNRSKNTLEEPIYMTIYNDIKMIGIKLNYILWTRKNYNALNNWDLWGPLIFCLLFCLCLSFTVPKSESITIFTSLFCIIWISELIITLNLKLLGIPISLFYSICILGYSLFPLVIITIINLFIPIIFIRFPLIVIGYGWSTYASLNVITDSSFNLNNKKLLAIYPLFLYYFCITFFLSWIVFLQFI